MKIIKSEQQTKYGNDCMFKYDISLAETEENYVVIYIRNLYGSWISEKDKFFYQIENFSSYEKAEKYFNSLIDK